MQLRAHSESTQRLNYMSAERTYIRKTTYLFSFDLWNIGISRQANYILRIEIIELSWTIPRLMRLEKVEVDQKCTSSSSSHLVETVGNKEVLFSDKCCGRQLPQFLEGVVGIRDVPDVQVIAKYILCT